MFAPRVFYPLIIISLFFCLSLPAYAAGEGDLAEAGFAAEHNGAQFETLQAALDAAEGGGEVTLLRDITESVSVKHGNTDLNLNGHTLTIPAGKSGIAVKRNGNQDPIEGVTLRGGTVTGSGVSIWIDVNNARGLVLRDMDFPELSIRNGNDGVSMNYSDAVMENCRIDGCAGSNNATKIVSVSSGTLTMNNCSITNCADIAGAVQATHNSYYKLSSTLTMNGCTIAGNSGTYTGGITSQGTGSNANGSYWSQVTLKDTVITDNSSTWKSYCAGGMTLSNTKLRMEGGAIYGNHIPGDAEASRSGADVFAYKGYANMVIPDPKEMRDGDLAFERFFWYDSIGGQSYDGAVGNGKNVYLSSPLGLELRREPVRVARNTRTAEEYVTLDEAVAAAGVGDTIQLCAEENEGGTAVAPAASVQIEKDLILDLNGHDLNSAAADGRLMTVTEGVRLRITGGRTKASGGGDTSEIAGTIENLGELEIAGAVSFTKKILHGGTRLFMEGDHGTVRVAFAKGGYIEADPALTVEKLEVYLLDAEDREALNDRSHDHEDILVVGGGNADLEAVTAAPEIDNPHVRRIYKADGERGEGIYLVDRVPTGVYLDGQEGDDGAAGTEDAPVKTFAKARDLLARIADGGEKPDGIYVMGTVSVTEEETWSLPEDTAMIRHESCSDELVRVSGSLTLKDIVLDGHAEGGIKARSPLVNVDGGTLTLGEGAVLRSNVNTSRSELTSMAKTGGGIVAQNGAKVLVEGGAVRDNEAGCGGGVGLYTGAALTVSGGEIAGNRALRTYHGSESDAMGGGVFLAGDTVMDLSGGLIARNRADRSGGGVSLGGHTTNTISADKDKKAVLNMTGGAIDSNVAGSCGGGVFVQANTVANVSVGSITNNTARGGSSGFFAGGGIYVNSNANQNHLDFGRLNLSNALITDNESREGGGGIGACPTSKTMMYASSGSAIYGNEAPSAHDVLVDHRTGTAVVGFLVRPDHLAYISHYMLGGGEARWLRDGESLYRGPEKNNELMGHSHLTTHGSLELKADPGRKDVEKALSPARVRITGNYSGSRGGGIGNNGDVYIGKPWEISVRKAWEDGDDMDDIRPDSIDIRLKASVVFEGETVEIPIELLSVEAEATLSEENEWSHTWKDLPEVIPDGVAELDDYRYLEITYTVDEAHVPKGYTAGLSGNMFDGYVITNTHEPNPISIPVVKKWVDEGFESMRPESITVELCADGKATGRTLELTKEGDWTGRFTDLPVLKEGRRIEYTVVEKNVPDGYTPGLEGSADVGFTLKNTYEPPTETVKTQGSEEPSEPDSPPAADNPSKPGTPSGSGTPSKTGSSADSSSGASSGGTATGDGRAHLLTLAALNLLAALGIAAIAAALLRRRRARRG